jgi:hypothetical protein
VGLRGYRHMEALWALLALVVMFGLLALATLVVRLVWTAGRRRRP